MKKQLFLTVMCGLLTMEGFAQKPTVTPASQMEKLDRGAVLIKRSGTTSNSYFLSWRLLGTDDANTTFTLLRDGQPYANGRIYKDVTSTTVQCNASQTFQVVTLKNGVEVDRTEPIKPWGKELPGDTP